MRALSFAALASASTFAFLLSLPACSSDVAGAADAGADQLATDGGPADSAPDGVTADASADAGACRLVKPYSSKDVACNSCAQTECCAEVNGCLGDTVCDDDYVNCFLACVLLPDDAGAGVDAGPDAGVPACVKRCDVQYPKGAAEYQAATSCVDTRCKADCK